MGHALLAGLLREQFGVATRDQLIATGMSARTQRRACTARDFEVVLPGVLRSSAHPVTFETRAMAAQLYLGAAGALSGPTAARIYGLRSMPAQRIWAVATTATRARLPTWLCRTTAPWLLAGSTAVRRHRGWRVLAPAPMLLTVAALFNDHRFERAAEDAWHLGLITPSDAAAFVDDVRRPGLRGVARFDRWLERAGLRARASQSGFEVDVIEALRRAGLPEPMRQIPVTLRSGETVHLDVGWPSARLAVEPGHSWWHGGDLRMRTDQARDRACGIVGWHVMRYDESYRSRLDVLAAEVSEMYTERLTLFLAQRPR
jgi:hypothetical protein